MLQFKETLNGNKTLLALFLISLCVLSLLLSCFYSPSSSYRSWPASWNWAILPVLIIHLLAACAPLLVSNSVLKSKRRPWDSLKTSLRSSSSGQSRRTCLGVSCPVPHLHWSDSYPGTLAFLRK